MLDVIEDKQLAAHNREIIKGVYSILKDMDEHLKFVFITGVTKFSSLNQLRDITLAKEYSAICGYT